MRPSSARVRISSSLADRETTLCVERFRLSLYCPQAEKHLLYVYVPRIGMSDMPNHVYDGGRVLGEGQEDAVLPRHAEGFAEGGASRLHAVKRIFRRRPENLIVQKPELVVEDGEIVLKFLGERFELDVIL